MNRTRVLAALGLVLAGLATAPFLFDRLDTSLDPRPSSESALTEAALIEATGSDGELVALIDGELSTDALEHLADTVRDLTGVTAAHGRASTERPGVALVAAQVSADLDDDRLEQLLEAFAHLVERAAPGQVVIGGSLALDTELGSTAERDLLRADAITIPLVLILLGIALGGLRAALLPATIVVVVVLGGLGVLFALTTVTTVSVFAVNIVTLFGIGLAVDYGLLIVSRFREQLASGTGISAAVAVTRRTAGRAVRYSALTTATSLSALLVFHEQFLRSLAYGGIAGTLLAAAAATWLLPPMLERWGHHIRPAPPRDPDHGAFHRLTRWIQTRPRTVALGSLGLLVVLALPLTGVAFEGLDARSLPASSPTRQLTERLPVEFPEVALAPVTVLADVPHDHPDLPVLVASVTRVARQDPHITPLGGRTAISVIPPGAAADRAAFDLVRDLRAIDGPVTFGVTGEASEDLDILDSARDRLPLAAGLLVVLMFGLLVVFTRAPVLAAKAVLINAISVVAAFGLLVWIFQDGNLAGLVGVEPIGALSAPILVLTFAFAFGLSMDYEVFVLARIREHYDRTGDSDLATARGLQQSGRIITTAAALIIVVFIGFAAGDLLLVKQTGIGLALAVAVDVTIVRLLLLPAAMTLLGRANWWAPGTRTRPTADVEPDPRPLEAVR
jgi:putative drug exporter of the RND superfamily